GWAQSGLAEIQLHPAEQHADVRAGFDQPPAIAFAATEVRDDVLRPLALSGEVASLAAEDLHAARFREGRTFGRGRETGGRGPGKVLGDGGELADGLGLVEGVEAFFVFGWGEPTFCQCFAQPFGDLVTVGV